MLAKQQNGKKFWSSEQNSKMAKKIGQISKTAKWQKDIGQVGKTAKQHPSGHESVDSMLIHR